MSFYNLPEEALTRIHTIQPKTRKGLNEEKKRNQESVIYIDTALRYMEPMLFRYALNFTLTPEEKQREETEETENKKKKAPQAATSAPKMMDLTPERPYPFPSPFLYTPKELYKHRWASDRESKASNSFLAEQLSNRHRAPPLPAELLDFTDPKDPSSCLYARHDPDAKNNLDANFKHEARDMYTLDLSTKPLGASQVYTVLQGELGLAVYADPSADVNNNSNNNLYLFSPDATSCVVVACRVQLNPCYKLKETEELEKTKSFYNRVCSAVTATMAHFDREENLRERLHEMLWEVALPAWLHTLGDIYKSSHDSAQEANDGKEEEKDIDVIRKALQYLKSLCVNVNQEREDANQSEKKHPNNKNTQCNSDALIHVQWYLVGGIRMEDNAAPVVEAILRTFFPPQSSNNPSSSDEKEERALLAGSAALSELIFHGGNQNNKPDKDDEEDEVVTVCHRLQEDGTCFWSLNSFMAPWQKEKQLIAKRYAKAVCYGLLLQVNHGATGQNEKEETTANNHNGSSGPVKLDIAVSGYCWPAAVAPGKRGYPLANVRQCVIDCYRWLCPIEHDRSYLQLVNHSEKKESGTNNNNNELVVAVNRAQTQTVANILKKNVSSFLDLHVDVEDANQNGNNRLTLRIFVQHFLRAVWHNGTLDCAGGKHNPKYQSAFRLLPILLRREPATAAACSSASTSASAVPLEWQQQNFGKDLNLVPDESFLGFSTTPHCEPLDFPALMREAFQLRSRTSAKDYFVPHVDGMLYI